MDGMPGERGEDGLIYAGSKGVKGLNGERGYDGIPGQNALNVSVSIKLC